MLLWVLYAGEACHWRHLERTQDLKVEGRGKLFRSFGISCSLFCTGWAPQQIRPAKGLLRYLRIEHLLSIQHCILLQEYRLHSPLLAISYYPSMLSVQIYSHGPDERKDLRRRV